MHEASMVIYILLYCTKLLANFSLSATANCLKKITAQVHYDRCFIYNVTLTINELLPGVYKPMLILSSMCNMWQSKVEIKHSINRVTMFEVLKCRPPIKVGLTV